MKEKNTFKKRLGVLLFVLLNVLVLGVTAYMDFGTGVAHDVPEKVDPLMLLGVVGCFMLAMAAETVKYFLMLRHCTGRRDLKSAFRVVALGKYYDNITPLGAGGQPFQGLYLARHGIPAGQAAAIPVAGFMTMQFAFILLAILVFLFGGSVMKLTTMKVAAVVGFVFYIFVPAALLFFMLMPRAAQKILRFFVRLLAKLRLVKDPEKTELKAIGTLLSSKDSLGMLFQTKGLFLLLMLLSLIYQLALCSMPYFVLHAFGNDLPYLQVTFTTVFVYLCITFVPTPGNSGMAEGSFYALFSVLGQGNLFWAMLVWRLFCYYLFIATGLIVVLRDAAERRKAGKRT